MSSKNLTGGVLGTGATSVNFSLNGDDLADCLLFKTFTATGVTTPVTVPGGVGQSVVFTATTGAPTTATVVAEGSNDLVNWFTLNRGSQPPSQTRHKYVRLNCTISGGTSPTLTVAALVAP